MQAEFLFCLRYVSLSEWFHWKSVRDGEVGAEEDNGPPRLSYQPMRKKSNGSVSTHKTYGIILRERIGSPSVHPRSSVHPPPTKLHYKSTLPFPSVFFTLDHVIRLFSRFMEMARKHVVAGIIENSFLLYLKTFSCKKKRITTMLIVQQWG